MFVFIMKEYQALWTKNIIKELLDEEISTAKLKNNKEYSISNNFFANLIIELKSIPCITIYKLY